LVGFGHSIGFIWTGLVGCSWFLLVGFGQLVVCFWLVGFDQLVCCVWLIGFDQLVCGFWLGGFG
jgi:hypothetical protein